MQQRVTNLPCSFMFLFFVLSQPCKWIQLTKYGVSLCLCIFFNQCQSYKIRVMKFAHGFWDNSVISHLLFRKGIWVISHLIMILISSPFWWIEHVQLSCIYCPTIFDTDNPFCISPNGLMELLKMGWANGPLARIMVGRD